MLNPKHDQHENGTDHKGRVEMHRAKTGDWNTNQFPGSDGGCCRSRYSRNGISCHLARICWISKPGQHFRGGIDEKRNGEQGVEDIDRCDGATQR